MNYPFSSITRLSAYSHKAVSLIRLTALLVVLLNPQFLTNSIATQLPPDTISSGYGPEDMVVDSVNKPSRLLVSCASRRKEYPAYGEIEAIIPASGARSVMTRVGEPPGLIFRPHGISLVQTGERQFLYAISHDDAKNIHPIVQFLVKGDSLIFIQLLESNLLVSPNALQAFSDGSLLVCNDAAVRNSMIEKILRLKRGNVLFYDGKRNWTIVAEKLGMPAGLTAFGTQIFISSALENKLYSFNLIDGELTGKKQVCRIKGPDNIRINKKSIITTSHSKPLRFIKHVKDSSNKSPSIVFSVDVQSGKPTQVFYDNGNLISAASVALIFNNQLIVGQIFEPYICVAGIQR